MSTVGHTLKSAKVARTRQFASYDMDANSLKFLTDPQILKKFPAPDWMQARAIRLWCDCIRSYEAGQIKRYNLPILEQYLLIYFNIQKLTRRIGYTSGLVKQTAEIDEDGNVEMKNQITHELLLYQKLLGMLNRTHAALYMIPRPFMLAGRGNMEDDIEGDLDDEQDEGRVRLSLIGGRKEAKTVKVA